MGDLDGCVDGCQGGGQLSGWWRRLPKNPVSRQGPTFAVKPKGTGTGDTFRVETWVVQL